MSFQTSTHQYQSSIANFCRTGKFVDIPGINKKNIKHYRSLVLNVIDDSLQNAYPLTYDLLSLKEWNSLVSDFWANHSCQSPQIWSMPKELFDYVSTQKHYLLDKYVFLEELLWFEWLELEMFMMEDIKRVATPNGDLLFNRLILNPEHRIFDLEYPVHKIRSKMISNSDRGKYFVIAHRNNKGDILFTDLSTALVRLIEYLNESPKSLTELIRLFEKEFDLPLSENDQLNIIQFFKNAFHQELIIGFERK